MSKVELEFDWEDHQHWMGEGRHISKHHYSDDEIGSVCYLCDEAARKSEIPDNKHHQHPQGCKCHLCVFCRCPEVCKRDDTPKTQ